MRRIYFATGNPHKVEEAKLILKNYNVDLAHLNIQRVEIQSTDLAEIATYSLNQIVKEFKQPVFVEDTGLFINSLNGFPGPFSSYVFKTLGNKGIIKLMKEETDRRALFKTVIAFKESDKNTVKIFVGETQGFIAEETRGVGWGYDPIFIPLEGDGRTYAEMSLEEKNMLSHRFKALKLLGESLRKV
ncbi:MAG: XTP/dITP diphosphatase [Candidatus Odinarchaeum yellowstonii]|uniref:dITP/XTP pyrophosphatase n=1 Tax=Odinarchaeota yellowstonii (strain LCB_4) TaxID=1841599 RepID=A0AAF0D156_ODILC|nr:MAG: XTP/dITP diphosphatase [Candidatus Odinarchaeum yellowstonii]